MIIRKIKTARAALAWLQTVNLSRKIPAEILEALEVSIGKVSKTRGSGDAFKATRMEARQMLEEGSLIPRIRNLFAILVSGTWIKNAWGRSCIATARSTKSSSSS